MGTRRYPPELRECAVRLYRESKPRPVIRRLAEQLNVHPETLRNWIRQTQADASERDDRPSTAMLEENRRLAKENAELRRVNEVLRSASPFFASEIDPNRRRSWLIDAQDIPVDLVLRVLGVASTYCEWRVRAAIPARRRRGHLELLALIELIRGEHEFAGTDGSPRVWLKSRRRGVPVGRKHIERIVHENGLRGAYLRKGGKGESTTRSPRHTTAPDLFDRDFTTTAPNRKWVAATGSGRRNTTAPTDPLSGGNGR
ncbi:transposase [Rhodococcus koreensis]